jgi:surface carbohydrate biosynthesis protein (TIGR04326 family)
MTATWLIWDADGEPPQGEWISVLWRSYGEGENPVPSLPRLVEERADALRSRYLAWVNDVGDSLIGGTRLVDHLELRAGFSYWWMTLIAEKSNGYKSPQIGDALKLLALEELTAASPVSTIILVSGNKTLRQTFRLWCRNAGWVLECRPLKGQIEPASGIKRIYHFLPQPVQAGIFLVRYIRERWPLRQKHEKQNAADGNAITFIDYLIHLDQKALTTGRFASNFWTGLQSALDSSGLKVNWLHHYIQHEAVPSTRRARDLIARFNQSGPTQQFHACLDSVLGIPVLLAALTDYLRLVRVSLGLGEIKRQFRPTGSRLDFWPLFQQDWFNSLRGPAAIWNCLSLNMFEQTFKRLPRQKLGVYLQENQGWEMSMIHAWRVAGHGPLIGVPHATVRYWDLRYFFDRRNYLRTGKNDLPRPDKVALNGPVALAAYRMEGYPEEQIVEVEALRYLYLADLTSGESATGEIPTGPLRVLVLGDYIQAITRRQIQWLTEAATSLSPDTRYVVKPHPNCPVRAGDYPAVTLQITDMPLFELLQDCDIVYSSNITSAAADAYCTGLPVVSVLDNNFGNMSPLRGLPGAMYVTKPAELLTALRSARQFSRKTAPPYFCLDKGLLRWRKLLGIGAGSGEST